jgi:hypothetical protein
MTALFAQTEKLRQTTQRARQPQLHFELVFQPPPTAMNTYISSPFRSTLATEAGQPLIVEKT